MSNPDMSMVARRVEPGWVNLAIGEPVFLQAIFRHLYPQELNIYDVEYPPCDGLPELKEILVRLGHVKPEHHIVITNGAKQALIAAMWAAWKVKHACIASSPVPYWPSLPTLARHGKMSWTPWPRFADFEILTFPNNPNGMAPDVISTSVSPQGPIRLWDAVYASPVFGYQPKYEPYGYDIVVGSLSKLYGLSGVRLGWAAFRNSTMAAAAAEYVETTTSGVSIPSQRYALKFLSTIYWNRGRQLDDITAEGRRILQQNADRFLSILGKRVDDIQGVPAGHGGMFAWFSPRDFEDFTHHLQVAKVQLVDGVYAGVERYYRMNLGVMPYILEDALHRINY